MTLSVPIESDPSTEAELRLKTEREPANAEAIIARARLLVRRGAADQAIPLYQTVASIRPGSPEAMDQLASIFIRRKDLIAADLCLSRITDPARQPRRVEVRRWMRKEAKRLIMLAREHEAQARADEAMAAYVLMSAHASDATGWRLEAIRFFLAVGRYEAAQAHLEDLEEDARVPQLLATARALRERSPWRRSAEFTRRLYEQALEDLHGGRAALAEPVLRELTIVDSRFSDAWIKLRAARLALGKTEAAAAALDQWRAEAGPAHEPLRRATAARPVSLRGLSFDRNERFRLVAKGEALTAVRSPEELKRQSDACLVLDPGGKAIVSRPFLPLEQTGAPEVVRITTKESFVLGLDYAMVVGRGAVITQRGEIIAEQFLGRKPRKYHASVDRGLVAFGWQVGRDLMDVRYVDEPVFLCMGPSDLSFGDWILQFPPRLMLAEAAGLDCRILVNAALPANFLGMLHAMGVDPRRVVTQKDKRAVVYRKVYAPCWPYGPLNRPIADWLKVYDRMKAAPAARSRPLLYLSRRHVKNRPLVNEDEIRELFLSHGFLEVLPETLTLPQAVDLFASPACVAGPWGSSFENLVFSQNHPVSFALLPPYHRSYRHSVGTFMHAADVRFCYERGEARGPTGPNTAPWYMPLDRAKRGLERVLKEIDSQQGGGGGSDV